MPTQKYWFPAKRQGWGWGLPLTWQGWIVLFAYLALLFLGVLITALTPGLFWAYAGLITAVLVGICWWKGEPPRWRGGDAE